MGTGGFILKTVPVSLQTASFFRLRTRRWTVGPSAEPLSRTWSFDSSSATTRERPSTRFISLSGRAQRTAWSSRAHDSEVTLKHRLVPKDRPRDAGELVGQRDRHDIGVSPGGRVHQARTRSVGLSDRRMLVRHRAKP